MDIDLIKIQACLEHKQAELQEHIHAFYGEQEGSEHLLSEDGTAQASEQGAVNLLTAQKQHSVLSYEILLLNEVRLARKRITEGTYGRCAMCGQPIPEKRLEALPGLRCASMTSNSSNRSGIALHCRNTSMERTRSWSPRRQPDLGKGASIYFCESFRCESIRSKFV